MGEIISQPTFEFNRAIRVEIRPERVSADGGAVLIREIMNKPKIDRWLGNHLIDFRREELVTHPWLELLRTKLILLGQGWRDNDDADFLRHDPALRLAVSERRGGAALFPGPEAAGDGSKNPSRPEGLASQPTLSRLVDAVAAPENLPALHDSLIEVAGRRIRAANNGTVLSPSSSGRWTRPRPRSASRRTCAWTRARRVVLVVQEKPDELFLHHFWLVTNWPAEQIEGLALLKHYRRRGLAEAHMAEGGSAAARSGIRLR